jgi:hypothetical protein
MFILDETCPRLEDNIKTSLEEIRHNDVNWIHLTQDKLVRRAVLNTVMKLEILSNVGKVLTS